jgi:peptide/nickel transport system substrate-binding protein
MWRDRTRRPVRWRRPRAVFASTLALIAVAALSGCMGVAGAATGNGKNGTGGTLRIAMSAGNIPFPATPPDQGYEGYRFVGNNIYDGLTKYNLDQSSTIPTPQPALATSWTLSPDKLTWTFNLRRGVTFQDGTPFNADAVIFQLNRENDPKFPYYDTLSAPRGATYFLFFKSWQKVDNYTVSITTKQPYAWLPYDLTHIYFPSPTVVKKYGNANYNQHATGTGPFIMTKYIDGQVMELSANAQYWAGRPKLDKIVLYPQPVPASRLAMLQSNGVEWAEVPSPDAIGQLKRQGYQTFMGEYPHGIMPRFNMFRAPFKGNVKLRQALNYALNRQGTAALVNNVGYPAKQYVYPGHPNYDPNFPGYTYDPQKAKQLLAEAGYQPGQLHLRFAYPTGGSGNMFPDPMMQQLQADFKAIGVVVELLPMEWSTILTIGLTGLNAPEWSKIDILWSSPSAGQEPDGYLLNFLCKRPGNKPNVAGLCNPGIDQAYSMASQSFDPKQSNIYLQQMMDAALKDADFLFWMHDLNLRVMSNKVHGFVQPKSWWVDFTKMWVG